MELDVLEELKSLDREALVDRMVKELPDICEKLKVSKEAIAEKTGVDMAKIKAAESGKRPLRWSEFMSILFVIWNNDLGKGILDAKGLFPVELKRVLSVNRNSHAPSTETAKWID